MDTHLFYKIRNAIIAVEKKSDACVTTVLGRGYTVQATSPRGPNRPPQSPGGSLATPAAESGTSGLGHKVVGGWLAFVAPAHPETFYGIEIR